ncbi:MAG: hypothetical protein Q4C03_07885 [bacterium]|nr:hypothetical protein [bacterium]MDO5463038.1 hypothetical protein [bacterium]
MKKILLLLTLLTLVSTGCSPYWYREHEGHQVSSSFANRLTISYQRAPDKPRVRCDIDGNGQVVLVEGNAAAVTDQFDISMDSTYGDVKKYSCMLSPKTITDNIQTLVNAGLLLHEEPDDEDLAFPRVLVSGRVNGIKVEKFTFKEDLITEIRILIMEYKRCGGYTGF